MKRIISARFYRYFISACIAAAVDVAVTTALFMSGFGLLTANITGNIHGLAVQYYISSRYVFNVRINVRSFLIHLLTFLIGLILCNTTIWVFYNQLHAGFLLSKAASIGVPFYFTYNLRIILNRYSDQLTKVVE